MMDGIEASDATAGKAKKKWTILGRTLELEDAFSARCFARAYEAFHIWVESTIESVRIEVWRMLFPLFANAYVRIVAGEEGRSVSRAFLERWTEAHSSNEFWDELSAGKLERFDKCKFSVRLGAVSAELVGEYLTRTANVCLIQLINERVRVEVIDSPVANAGGVVLLEDPSEEQEVVISEAKAKVTSAGFLDELKLGALAESVVDARTLPTSEAAKQLPASFFDADTEAWANRYAEALLTRARRPANTEEPRIYAKRLSALDPTALALTLVDTGGDLSCVTASKDARRLAAGFSDSCLRVYKIDELLAVQEYSPPAKAVAHRGPLYGVDWERDARYLLSSAADGCAVLWDTCCEEAAAASSSGRALCRYRAHPGVPCWDVRWCDLSRGHLFATAGADKTARVFTTDRIEATRVFVGHWADVSKCVWHPNAHYLLTGSYDKQCRLWDLRAGKCCRVLDTQGSPVTAVDVAVDGKYAAAGCSDGSVHIWHLDSAKRLGAHTPPRQQLQIQPYRASSSSGGSKRRRSATDIAPSHELSRTSFPAPPVYAVAFSSDGAALASGGKDHTLRLFTSIDQSASLQPHHTYHTKATPILHLSWTHANLCLLAGPLLL